VFEFLLPADPTSQHIVLTLLVISTAIALRLISIELINRSAHATWEVKRKRRVSTNSILTFVVLILLLFIWSTELQTLALSFVAFAVAFVFAAKELFMCLTGGLLRTNYAFAIGDRIEVAGIRGDVIDKNLLSTKVLEIGPGQTTHQYTGRSVTIPNSFFLSHTVINESFLGNFVLHPFTIPLRVEENWREAEKILLRVSHEECSSFYDAAQTYLDRVQRKANLETPSIHPRVHIRVVDQKMLHLIVRVTIPAYDKGKIEQAIVKRFLSEFNRGVPLLSKFDDDDDD
jgi:small-conductance mechanosensitive channel